MGPDTLFAYIKIRRIFCLVPFLSVKGCLKLEAGGYVLEEGSYLFLV